MSGGGEPKSCTGRQIANAEKFRMHQQQAGLIADRYKKVKPETLLKLYDEHGKINKKSYGRDSYIKGISIFSERILMHKILVLTE